MEFNNLPDDVMLTVLEKTAKLPAKSLNEWVNNRLPLMWVCHKWRYALARHVFSQVFIDWMEKDSGDPDLNLNAIPGSAVQIVHNIECFKFNKCKQFAKQLDFNLSYPTTEVLLIPLVVELLKQEQTVWSNINSLAFKRCPYFNRSADTPEADPGAEMGVCVNNFVQYLPNIKNITVFDQSYGYWFTTFTMNLAKKYTPNQLNLKLWPHVQAQSIISEMTGTCNKVIENPNGECISIKCQNALQKLHVDNVCVLSEPHQFVEARKRVEFTNLTELRVTGHDLHQLSDPTLQHKPHTYDSMCSDCTCLIIPNIQKLAVERFTNSCLLFSNKNNFSNLRELNITRDRGAAKAFSLMNITTLDRLSMSIDCTDTYAKGELYLVINRLFGNISVKSSARLKIIGVFDDIDIDKLTCTKLTILDIKHGKFDKVIKFVSKLPKLEYLEYEFGSIGNDEITSAKAYIQSYDVPSRHTLRYVLARSCCKFETALSIDAMALLAALFPLYRLDYYGIHAMCIEKRLQKREKHCNNFSRFVYRGNNV